MPRLLRYPRFLLPLVRELLVIGPYGPFVSNMSPEVVKRVALNMQFLRKPLYIWQKSEDGALLDFFAFIAFLFLVANFWSSVPMDHGPFAS